MYRTLKAFTDGENGIPFSSDEGGFYYAAGDAYPKAGYTPSKDHVEYLLSNDNRFASPAIEKFTKKARQTNETPDKEAGDESAGTLEKETDGSGSE